ncbi:hypothetical protein B0A52_05221 [Exophiala mesophila]|uniref:AAA+ ATPase domain-containing protein n=1 Tax=Exophiala mesophila TaxID=212818 RepID=A0A438N495_EXOME|nr:hypothetical protein B0A52_05221 [Exophiala mesophila]
MDIQRMARGSSMSATSSLIDLPEYIMTSFLPGARPLLDRYPRLFRFLGTLLALWYFGPLTRLQTLWYRFSSLLVSSVTIANDEDLFQYMTSYIAGKTSLRADQSLIATLNQPGEPRRRHRMDPEYEEISRSINQDPKVRFEPTQGLQMFIHQKRIFYVARKYGDGDAFVNSRLRRAEVLTLYCLGRSPQPIKDLVNYVYYLNKDKERGSTIIRRPYNAGYGSRLTWSRLTSKPRRGLNTVVLEANQKLQVIADVAEYMAESTMTFYADHGIPYRRGYLFHGPPGVGKTSLALAVAAKFKLDVYNLTLLDEDLTDSGLISLLNQLPARSLLLLEDVDSAGLGRKAKSRRNRRAKGADTDADDDSDSDSASTTSRVTLSGLLNAIDGVAAPEGHVLIMTTNKPHDLDDALVRAGRISCRVAFTQASKAQAEEIFLNMYVERPQSISKVEVSTETLDATDLAGYGSHASPQLRQLSKAFADAVPDFDFSPADLQDYLLMHKSDAQKAVDQVGAWREEKYQERALMKEEIAAEREAKKARKAQQVRKAISKQAKLNHKPSEGESSADESESGSPEDETKTDGDGESEKKRDRSDLPKRGGMGRMPGRHKRRGA